MNTPMDAPHMELNSMEFPFPPNSVEKIRRPSMAYRASTYSGRSSNSSTSSLRSSIRSSSASGRSIKSVRFHETRDIIVSPEPELSWAVPAPEIQVTPAKPAQRGGPHSLRSKWSFSSLGQKSEETIAPNRPTATSNGGPEADFEAWLAKTAVMGRVEGFGKDERGRDSKASAVPRRLSPRQPSADKKKSRRQSWMARLSGV